MNQSHLDLLNVNFPLVCRWAGKISRGDGAVLFLEGLSTTLWHRPEWQDKCWVEHSPYSFGAGIPQCKQTHSPLPPCVSVLLPLPELPRDGWPALAMGGWTEVCVRVHVCSKRRPWSWTQRDVSSRTVWQARSRSELFEGALIANHGANALRAPLHEIQKSKNRK